MLTGQTSFRNVSIITTLDSLQNSMLQDAPDASKVKHYKPILVSLENLPLARLYKQNLWQLKDKLQQINIETMNIKNTSRSFCWIAKKLEMFSLREKPIQVLKSLRA